MTAAPERVPAATPRLVLGRRAWALGAGALLLAGGTVALVLRRGRSDVAREEPTPVNELERAFSERGIQAGDALALLAPTPEVRAWAQAAAGSADGSRAKAQALVNALRKRAEAEAFVPWSLGEAREGDVRAPDALLTKLATDHARAELYPLELAALVVAGLRALDVPALVGELTKLPGERAPRDPSGYIGYFVVRVPDGQGGWQVFDPWAGKALAPDAHVEPVTDAQAVSAALALDALGAASYALDTERALRLSSDALTYAGSLPSVRAARGLVVLGAGMPEQALQELEAARQLRADAARTHDVASAFLVLGEVERAKSLLAHVLADAPELASAHVTQSVLLTLAGDADAGDRELARAEELSPTLSSVQFALAERAFARGDRDAALARATSAAEARPTFDALFRLAMMQRHASRISDMQGTAARMLARAPGHRKDEIRALLTEALGPSAFDAAQEVADDAVAPDARLQLRAPTLTLPKRDGVPKRQTR